MMYLGGQPCDACGNDTEWAPMSVNAYPYDETFDVVGIALEQTRYDLCRACGVRVAEFLQELGAK